MKSWEIEGQPEFDFSDCYLINYPPLDLSKYEGDRNYNFYKLQNELVIEYNKTGEIDKNILWKMFPYIEGVVSSLAKKNVCAGCNVPNFAEKCLEATTRIMLHYSQFPYFRAEKLENVAFHKVREVFFNGNLQLNERAGNYDYVLELLLEKEKNSEEKRNKVEKTAREIRAEKLEKKEMSEIKEFHNWQKKHKRG